MLKLHRNKQHGSRWRKEMSVKMGDKRVLLLVSVEPFGCSGVYFVSCERLITPRDEPLPSNRMWTLR